MNITIFFALLVFFAPQGVAGLTLTPPGGVPDTGFFDGYTNNLLAPVSSAQFPEKFGVAGIKVFGVATANANGANGAFVQMQAVGGVAGALEIDAILQVNYYFQSSVTGIAFEVQGLVGTNNGGYFGQAAGLVAESGIVTGSFFLNNGSTSTVPAGNAIEAWILVVTLGTLNDPTGPAALTLTIPSNSVDLVAFGEDPGAPTPEPASFLLAAPALLLAGRRHLMSNR